MNENRNFIVGALALAAAALGSVAYFGSATNTAANNQPLNAAVMEDLRGRISADIGNIVVQGSDIFVGYHLRSANTLDVLLLAKELASKAQRPVQVHAVQFDQMKQVGTATPPDEWCVANATPQDDDHATGSCWEQFNYWTGRMAKAKANVEKARQKLLDSMVVVVPLTIEVE